MKNMKSLLKILGGIAITAGTASSVAACSPNSGTATNHDISSGVAVENLHTTADTTSTYNELNWFSGITDIVDAAIQNVFGVSVTDGIDFILSNDQLPTALQAAGTLVTFTVTAIDSLLNSSNVGLTDDVNPNLVGSFTFTDTLSNANISYDVNVADQTVAYTDNYTYASLYSNSALINAVINAIQTAKNVTVAYPTDFKLNSLNDPSAFVKKGDKIVIMAIAKGTKIKGSFDFNVIIN